MPRQQGIAIENSFIKGLITENTALNFPRNAATEQDNCVFDEKGRVTRRPGIDYEDDYDFTANLTFEDGEAYSEFVWDQVNGLGTVSFLVQQQGATLHFYDISLSTTASPHKILDTLDLTDYLATDTALNPASIYCSYAQGNGDLIVVNQACDPFYVDYDEGTGAFTATRITIRYRDFEGLDPEDAITSDSFRPTATTATLKTTYPKHLYNLMNQGWWQGGVSSGSSGALVSWDTEGGTPRTDMPANTDILSFYRGSATDVLDMTRISTNAPGSTLAPKGHFILRLGDADRAEAFTNEGFTLDSATSTTVPTNVDPADGSEIGNFTSETRAFDGSSSASNYAYKRGTAESSNNVGAGSGTTPSGSGFIGKDFGSGTEKKISKVTISNSAIMDVADFTAGSSTTSAIMRQTVSTDIDVQFYLYGSNTLPTTETGPGAALLGTATLRSKTVSNDRKFNRAFIAGGLSDGDPGAITLDESLWGNSGSANIDSFGSAEFNDNFNLSQGNTVINSNAPNTAYRYVWVRAVFDGSFVNSFKKWVSENTIDNGTHSTTSHNIECRIHEISFVENITTTSSTSGSLPGADITTERPTCVEFFAGRVWYSGVQSNNLGNNIYFSQIIENEKQYGRCYQKYDPTSDTSFDLLPTDGGVIKIPEMGRVVKLFNYQTSLLVFASNGVWIIRGGDGGFTATDFVVRKLSSNGTQSPLSFIDVEGFPIWWGEDGIFILQYNPQFDSFSVSSMTDDTIRSFYQEIPVNRRKFAKGCYDFIDNIAYWLFSDNTSTLDEYDYNRMLCLNVKSKAFYSWTFALDDPKIKGIAFIEDSIGDTSPKVILTTTLDQDATNTQMTYSDFKFNIVEDWATYNGGEGLGTEFESYFVTGYMVDGETQRFIQGMYVFFFMDILDDESGAYVQGVYDFTTSGDSGKWSSAQQIYNPSLGNRSISQTRRKIRGKGRALQLRVSSDGNKPFSIVGWSVNETSNASI